MKAFFRIEVRDAFTNQLRGEIRVRHSDQEFVIGKSDAATSYATDFETFGEAKAVARTFERNPCCDHYVFEVVAEDGYADEAFACEMESDGPNRGDDL